MAAESESEADAPLDKLWKEYGSMFRDFDDLTLARWMCQTLGQLEGKSWRLSHPLLGAYRLASQAAHERQVWLKRLATPPQSYLDSECCRAPMLPLVTRDILDAGLICEHCGGMVYAFDDLPLPVQERLRTWAERYGPVHAVAHWDDRQRKSARNYDRAFENAAREAEGLLVELGGDLAPSLLDLFPAVVWEDQDECLEVEPEDIELG